ncbi:alanine racemase [Paenarthrobacter aurescens]|uniref:Alanine racemase n=1 Tax=Paenarthrobacter aurescens TaxID=43663 RepID=A0A4Y3NAE7_PAEAU|nr:alanine racemase [Paenarthrobacter aurescens]MDO6142777.1 alanine racemase [Paenarthrobacter aurescens]MDO6146623.1 alanine racemase [Paenarthrobacter aurescens]MDO6157869.1 alanine racemase [Paenarthrobacter aurescens]MDO6161853.1 alanine racemase [Paenarthrobacter aurescens]GEB18820.1 alanine racemase [Paenarthrobacter aurescens]
MRRNAHYQEAAPAALSGQVTVDLSAISENVKALKKRTEAPFFMAVVKGNAYGHGLVEVARTAVEAGADWLGTAQLSEAISLRQAGITVPILSWLYLASQTSATILEALENDIDVSLGSVSQLEVLAGIAKRLGRPAVVHLELDSGLSRGGARKEDWAELVAQARQAELDGTLRVRGLWTHLAWADVPAHPGNATAVAEFEDAVTEARKAGLNPGLRHVSSSANILDRPEFHFDMVRAGLAIYGLAPADHLNPADFGLRPALSVTAPLVMVKKVPAGTGVSYEHQAITYEPRYLGLIPLGYADGIPKGISGRSVVNIAGRSVPVIGKVCMDQFMVDLGPDASGIAVGDTAVLFGDPACGAASADHWGAAIGSHGDEIINRIAPRLPRAYANGAHQDSAYECPDYQEPGTAGQGHVA